MNKKKVLLIVIGVLLIVSVSIGLTYAYYMATVTQNGENVVKTDCFEISYADKDEISLSDSFPMRDADGANLTPYEFTIKNVCENTQYYEVNLETLSSSTIDESKLKVKLDNKTAYLYGNDGYASNKVISDAKNAIQLASGILTKNQEKTYSLRLYVDESVTTSTPNIQNKSYLGKVTIYAALNNRNFSIAIQRNNSTIKEDRVQGTKLDGVQYEYDLAQTDISNATNISCNEDATADIVDNKLKVSNMHENTICKINDSIKSTIDNLDDSLTNIKMIKNEDNVEKMTIASTNDVVLDLNGKEINSNDIVFSLFGKMTVNDNNIGVIKSTGNNIFYTYNNSNLILNNVNLTNSGDVTIFINGEFKSNNSISECTDNCRVALYITPSGNGVINNGTFKSTGTREAIDSDGILTINYATVIGEGQNAINTYNDKANVTINDGVFTSTKNTISTNKGTITINNGTFTSTRRTIENRSGTININGGIFKSSTDNDTISNQGSGIINITDKKNKVYIINNGNNTLYGERSITNYGTGTVNIDGSVSDICSINEENNTGICIAAYQRTILDEVNATGAININGASITSENYLAISNYSGTMNIKNSFIDSYDNAINLITNNPNTVDTSNTLINICNSTINSEKKDLVVNSYGTINYSSNVIFTDGTNTPNYTNAGNGTITKTDDACAW